MNQLRKYRPVLGMCSQGQRKTGVNKGCMYLYENLFRDICDYKPYAIAHQ